MLLISFEASACGVVTIRLPFSSTGVERTSLSLASKKVNPVWPVDSQVNFFYDTVRPLSFGGAVVGALVLACS